MSGKKDKKAINLIGSSSGPSRKKKVAAKAKRRSKPARQAQKGRTRARRR
jgi:hypothetical protein